MLAVSATSVTRMAAASASRNRIVASSSRLSVTTLGRRLADRSVDAAFNCAAWYRATALTIANARNNAPNARRNLPPILLVEIHAMSRRLRHTAAGQTRGRGLTFGVDHLDVTGM